jgi:uncharacterized repeat protein (TIGR01451 family)
MPLARCNRLLLIPAFLSVLLLMAPTLSASATTPSVTGGSPTNRSADLAVTALTADPFDIWLHPWGENVTYTITVRNNGPHKAQNVVVTDAWYNGGTLKSVTASPAGWSCTGTSQVSCTNTSLSPGASLTIAVAIHYQLGCILAHCFVVDTSTVSSTNPDPVPANNSETILVPEE